MRPRNFLAAFCLVALTGCVSTPYKGVAASALSDDQLITELNDVLRQLGISTAGLQALRAALPPPDMRITARSFTVVSLTTQVHGDTAYTSGTATTTTRYDVTDENQLARDINQVFQGIQQGRIDTLSKRQNELVFEAQRRIAGHRQRQREIRAAIEGFFVAYPALRAEIPLLEAILPWEQRPSDTETLAHIGFEADTVVADRSSGTSAGRWYGTLEATVGGKSVFSSPVRGKIEFRNSETSGTFETSRGSRLVLTGSGTRAFVGSISSPDSSLASDMSASFPAKGFGLMAPRSVQIRFSTDNVRAERLEGILTLSR